MTAMSTDPFASRLVVRRVSEHSVGFLVAGASAVAGRWMVDAIRQQPPQPGSIDAATSWIAGVYSHNERRARDFADAHRIPHAGDDLARLLERPDIHCVYVGNHPRHHAETVEAALRAGKHVLVEPPLALTLDSAASLANLARDEGKVLAANYTWRATSCLQRLRALLEENIIDEILGGRIQNSRFLRPDQHTWRLQAGGGGVILDRTLHDIDAMRFLLGTGVRDVFGQTSPRLLSDAVEDELMAVMRMTGGLAIQVYDTFLLPHAPVTVELFGSAGSLIAYDCDPEHGTPQLLLRRGERTEQVPLEFVNPYRAAVARFLAALRRAAPPLADAGDDLQNLAAALAMAESVRRQGRVQLVSQLRR